MNWDVLRYVAMFLYFMLVSQTLAAGYYYWQYTVRVSKARGVIARHVWVNAIGVVGLASEVVFQNIEHLGDGFTWYVPINLVLLGYMNFAVYEITNTERRRYTHLPPKDS